MFPMRYVHVKVSVRKIYDPLKNFILDESVSDGEGRSSVRR